MERTKGWSYRKALGSALLLASMMLVFPAHGQELLKAIEPGTGYSRMKQWAIEHDLSFENFTKDSLIITGPFQETGDSIAYGVRIISKFCAGDDYSGRAYNTTLQQSARVDSSGTATRMDSGTKTLSQVFQKHQQYVVALAGKASEEGRFAGDFKLRRSRAPDQQGVAVGLSSPQGDWELGVFFREPYLMIQVVRTKDELCK
jgi:hypothetical protein